MLILEFVFTLYVAIGLIVQLADIICNFEYWKGERGSFILLMAVVFAFLWPVAVINYLLHAWRKWKGGLNG